MAASTKAPWTGSAIAQVSESYERVMTTLERIAAASVWNTTGIGATTNPTDGAA